MHFSVSFKILGILLMLFSSIQLVPLTLALLEQDGSAAGFVSAICITFFSGLGKKSEADGEQIFDGSNLLAIE